MSDTQIETAAVIALASANVPTDVQELLVAGNPMLGVAPHALMAAIDAAVRAEREAAVADLSDPTGDMWLAGRKVIDAELDKAGAAQSYAMRSAILDRIPDRVWAAMIAAIRARGE